MKTKENNNIKIVQFTHPGSEHTQDRGNKGHKSWNTKSHKRKFIQIEGEYIEDGILKSGSLMFWGEWEPPSRVTKLDKSDDKFMPKYLHRPYLPEKIPVSEGYQKSYQNTDPYVYGDYFKYFVCKQWKSKSRKETSLARLEPGSVILFGSTGHQNKPDAFFQLDTVFVVGDYIEYDPSYPDSLKDFEDQLYYKIVYKMAFPTPIENSLKLRLYKGATYKNQINGMYSFSPVKTFKGQLEGFPRVKLKDLDFITNNLNSAPKMSDVTINQAAEFWNKIREISRKAGFIEGVKFNL